jgi:MFS family permease
LSPAGYRSLDFLIDYPRCCLVPAALAIIACGLMIMALWNLPIAMALGAAVLALGVTLSTPAFFSAIFATAGPAERGAASGTASVFLDLGMGGGPIFLGLAAHAGGIPLAFGAAAAVAGRWNRLDPGAEPHRSEGVEIAMHLLNCRSTLTDG